MLVEWAPSFLMLVASLSPYLRTASILAGSSDSCASGRARQRALHAPSPPAFLQWFVPVAESAQGRGACAPAAVPPGVALRRPFSVVSLNRRGGVLPCPAQPGRDAGSERIVWRRRVPAESKWEPWFGLSGRPAPKAEMAVARGGGRVEVQRFAPQASLSGVG